MSEPSESIDFRETDAGETDAGEAGAGETNGEEIDAEVVRFEEIDFTGRHMDEALVQLIRFALQLPASDILFAWNDDDVTVSMRHLGTLRSIANISRNEARRVINFIKANAGMDLALVLRPLDGRLVYRLDDGQRIDLRINTIPTLHGEDMAVRLIARNAMLLELDNLGLHPKDLGDLRGLLNSPSGLILVTGPSGSGKTTTLYACLNYLNDGTRKINTIEDPIEYAMDGVRQSAINQAIHLDFPELLRSILRQSADVIMVGEIRDPVTAETAVRAANSGQLVLTTLHAPIAAGAIDSMLALGVHPHFLSTCLLGIMTQRLVRTLCPECRISVDISESPHTFDEIRRWIRPDQGSAIFSSPGCEHCGNVGYDDRTGVFEVLRSTKEIRRLVAEGSTAREIREEAIRGGMLDMRRSALLKVAEGITSTEEVIRVIPSEHLAPDE